MQYIGAELSPSPSPGAVMSPGAKKRPPTVSGAAVLTSAAAPASTSAPAPPASSIVWKGDFGSTDLVVAMFFGTAFLFLTLLDYSFDAHVLAGLTEKACTAANPLVQSLVVYYEWKTGGGAGIKYWEWLILCMMPLFIFGALKDNADTLRGRRAHWARHLLDLEGLVQLALVMGTIATKVAPATEKLIALVRRASAVGSKAAQPDAELYALITELTHLHLIVFGLNALQWCVPLLKVVVQRKQDESRQRNTAAVPEKQETTKHSAVSTEEAEKEEVAATPTLRQRK